MNKPHTLACPNCGSTMEVRMIGSNYKEGYCPVCDTRVDLSHTIPQQQTPQAINVHIPVASQQNTGNAAGIIVAIAAALVVLIGGVVAFAVQTNSSTSTGSSSISISEPIISYSGGDLNSSAPPYVELKNSNPVSLPQWLSTMALSSDGSLLAVAGHDSYVAILDGETFEVLNTLKDVNSQRPILPEVKALAFSPDGSTLAIGSRGDAFELWDVENMQRTARLTLDAASTFNDMHYTADGSQIIAATSDRNILVINVPGGNLAMEIELPVAPHTIGLINDETQVVAGMGTQKRIVIYDLTSGELVQSIATDDQINVVVASPDGSQFAALGNDVVTLYDAASAEPVTTLTTDILTFSPRAMAYTWDGAYIAAGNFFNTGVVWEVESGVELVHFEDVRESQTLLFNPGATRLLTIGGTYSTTSGVGEGNLVRVWDVEAALAEEEPEAEVNTEPGDAEAIDESTE